MRPLSPSQELAVTEKADEAKALVRLAFDELSRVPGGIWATPKAVASRAFKLTPERIAKLVQVTHNGISGAVYGSLRAGTHTLGIAAGGGGRSNTGGGGSTPPPRGPAV